MSHQPGQNQADGGTAQIKINPTQLSDQMDHPVLTLHEFPPLLGAGAGDGQGELVHGDAPRDGQVIDALVRSLAGQQLPQHHAVTEMEGIHFRRFGVEVL